MQTHQADYFAAYRSLKLTQDADGVLVVEFHSNGGPFIFTARDHTEFVDACYRQFSRSPRLQSLPIGAADPNGFVDPTPIIKSQMLELPMSKRYQTTVRNPGEQRSVVRGRIGPMSKRFGSRRLEVFLKTKKNSLGD